MASQGLCASLSVPLPPCSVPLDGVQKKSRRGFRQIISATETPFRKLNKICCQGPMFATIFRFDFFLAIFFSFGDFLGVFRGNSFPNPKWGGSSDFSLLIPPYLHFFCVACNNGLLLFSEHRSEAACHQAALVDFHQLPDRYAHIISPLSFQPIQIFCMNFFAYIFLLHPGTGQRGFIFPTCILSFFMH